MDANEYRQKNEELIEQIDNYYADNAEHELQIALNNKAIIELEQQRKQLYKEYLAQPLSAICKKKK